MGKGKKCEKKELFHDLRKDFFYPGFSLKKK